jgi:hypothetical protein
MSRLFDDLSSEHLYNNNAVVSGTPLTLACFVRGNDNPASGISAMSIADSGGDLDYHYIALSGPGGGQVGFCGSRRGGTLDYGIAGSWTLNQWHHLGGVFASSTSRTGYLDGVGGTPNTTSITPTGLDKTGIGAIVRSTLANPFSGDIAEVAVWNIDLTDDEMAALAAGFCPLLIRPGNLVAYWPLIRGLKDRMGGYDLTASGTTVSPHCRVIYPTGIWVPSFSVSADLSINIYDSIGLTDDVAASIPILEASVADNISVTDEAQASLNLYEASVSDDVGLSDYVNASLPVLLVSAFDTLSITDEPAVSIPVLMASVSDAVGLTDDAAAALTLYEISIYDGVTVTESVGIYLDPLLASAFDLVGIAEVVNAQITAEGILQIAVGDTLVVVDSVAAQLIAGLAVGDTLNVTDAVSITRLPNWALPAESSSVVWSKPSEPSSVTWSKVGDASDADWSKV